MNHQKASATKKMLILGKNQAHKPKKQWIRKQIIALVAVSSTLPILATKTYAETSNYQVLATQYESTEPAETSQSARVAFVPRRRLPLYLVAETGVGLLLLVGLVSAYLANRKQQSLSSSKWEAEFEPITTPSETNTTASDLVLSPSATTSLVLPSKTEYSVIESTIEQADIFREVTQRLRRSLDLEDLYKSAAKEVRRAIKTDRILIYAFNSGSLDGNVIAEAVAPGLPQTLRMKFDDPCFRERYAESYKQGRVRAIDDIYQEPGLAECYIKFLEQFAVKASLVAPILYNDEVFGLLIAHQCDRPRNWHYEEITLFSRLAAQVGLTINQVALLEEQEAEAERALQIQEIHLSLQQAFDIEDLFKIAVKEIRRALRTDRVVIYQLDPVTCQGEVIAEAVASGLPQTLRVKIEDPCFRDRHVELYKQGRVRAIDDIYQEPDLPECYIKLLEQFAVKASLVVPIVQNEELFGLLIAHQCNHPRTWQDAELNFFSRLAVQVGFAINQMSV